MSEIITNFWCLDDTTKIYGSKPISLWLNKRSYTVISNCFISSELPVSIEVIKISNNQLIISFIVAFLVHYSGIDTPVLTIIWVEIFTRPSSIGFEFSVAGSYFDKLDGGILFIVVVKRVQVEPCSYIPLLLFFRHFIR